MDGGAVPTSKGSTISVFIAIQKTDEMRISLFSVILLTMFSLNGCISHDQLLNYRQGLSDPSDSSNVKTAYPLVLPVQHIPTIKIQANDVLSIKVYSTDVETAAPFNITPMSEAGNLNTLESIKLSGYLVDKQGVIDFPVLGRLYLDGLSISEAKEEIKEALKKYLKDPVVNIRLLNFTVTVSGEVNNQGSFSVFSERISLPDALALAGGLTDYANRTNLLIVRESNDTQIFNRIDLTSSAVFQSEYYYLKQNDLIYVEPIKAKAGAVPDQTSKTIPIISAAGTLIAIIVALLK